MVRRKCNGHREGYEQAQVQVATRRVQIRFYSSVIHPPCPNMIIGISLVVNELNKGQRMVFRYPESIPASVEQGQSKGLKKLYNQYFSLR
jgi:hypothetical protein